MFEFNALGACAQEEIAGLREQLAAATGAGAGGEESAAHMRSGKGQIAVWVVMWVAQMAGVAVYLAADRLCLEEGQWGS